MIVTGGRLAPDAGEAAAADIGLGAPGSVADSLAGGTRVFAGTEAAGTGRVDAVFRFVAFTTGGFFFASSVSLGVSTTGGVAIAGKRRAGAFIIGAEYETSAALARCSVFSSRERELSLAGGHCGTAIVAITTTAIPASIPNCLPVVCHGSVAWITGAASAGGVDSTAGGEAGTGGATGAAVVAVRVLAGAA